MSCICGYLHFTRDLYYESFYLSQYILQFIITYKIILNLRKHHFDIGISAGITPVKKSKLFMKLCGVKEYIGFQASDTNKYGYDIHFVEANIKTLVLELSDNFRSQLYVESYFKMLEKTKPIIGLCIGNADPSLTNRWLRTGRIFSLGLRGLLECIIF